MRVMLRAKGLARHCEQPGEVQRAALLHDVMEDCGVTKMDLQMLGFSYRTIVNIEIVSRFKEGRDKKKTYKQWIQWILDTGYKDGVIVKAADLADNLSPRRVASLPETEQGIARRYTESMNIFLARYPFLVELNRDDMYLPEEKQ